MDVERFRSSPIGRVVPITVEQNGQLIDHHAFKPAPLPKSVDLSTTTYKAIERAAIELGLLEGVAAQLDSPYWITRPAIRREAVSTSAIEGTFSTLEEVFAADLQDIEPESQAVQEVANYVAAAEFAVHELERLPVSRNLIMQLHEILMQATEHEASSGRLRREQVAIGSRGSLITEARFVPPPPGSDLDDLFTDWERWNYRDDDLPVIARIAISHYQFETIHPFIDGNGRIGRLVAILLLIDIGPLSNHYLVLSPYIEARRDRYIDLLSETTATGDFDPWVGFFANAVEAEARAAKERIVSLLEFRTTTVARIRGEGLRGTIVQIAEQLFERPVVTPTAIARQFDVSYQTANRAISTLVDLGVLAEVTGRSYGRIFLAEDVLRILRLGPS